jgi:hypothetical protein
MTFHHHVSGMFDVLPYMVLHFCGCLLMFLVYVLCMRAVNIAMKQSDLQSLMFKSVALLAQTPYVDTRQAALTALHSVLQVRSSLITLPIHIYACKSCCYLVPHIWSLLLINSGDSCVVLIHSFWSVFGFMTWYCINAAIATEY